MWLLTCKKKEIDHFLTPHTKISSKNIKDLNLILGIIKILEEKKKKNKGETLSDINHSNIFFDRPPRIIDIKIKN